MLSMQFASYLCYGEGLFIQASAFLYMESFVSNMAAGLLNNCGSFFLICAFLSSKAEEQVLTLTCKVFVSSRLTASDIFLYTVLLLISGYLLTMANYAYAF